MKNRWRDRKRLHSLSLRAMRLVGENAEANPGETTSLWTNHARGMRLKSDLFVYENKSPT